MTKQVTYIADDYFLDNGDKLKGYIFNCEGECLQFEQYVSQENWQAILSDKITEIWKKVLKPKIIYGGNSGTINIYTHMTPDEKKFIEKYDLIVEPINNKNKDLNNKDLWIGFYNSILAEEFFSKSDYDGDFLKLPQDMKNDYYISINIDTIIGSDLIEEIFKKIKNYIKNHVGFNNIYKTGRISK